MEGRHQRGCKSVPETRETGGSAKGLLKGPEDPSQVLWGLGVN